LKNRRISLLFSFSTTHRDLKLGSAIVFQLEFRESGGFGPFAVAFIADDQEALKKLALPNVSKGEAIRKLRSYWSRLGFWPLGNSGIYLLSLSQRGCEVSSLNRVKGLQ
jgi:hypothetical protein